MRELQNYLKVIER